MLKTQEPHQRAQLPLSLMMGSWRRRSTAWLSSTVAAMIPIAIAAMIPITRLETGHVSFQACFQRSRTATLDSFRQVAPYIIAGHFTTGISCIVGSHVLRKGQQHIDLTVAKDSPGRDRGPIGCCAREGPLV